MSDTLWTSAEIEAAAGGRATAPFAARGISIDTRTLEPGDLFVALKDVRDGHDFVEAAMAAGAAGAFVSRKTGEGPQIVVDDVVPALERLGAAARDRAGDANRIAVTGSVGKTSVKEMIARMHRARGPAHWSVKSFNNHWGVPLTLARMPADTQNAIFEIGMSTPGEIAPRSRMVAPHTAMITKIAPAHLEGVGSMEGVAREKADIFAGLADNGRAVLPADDEWFEFLAERAKAHCPSAEILTFGTGPDVSKVEAYETDGAVSRVQVACFGARVSFTLKAVGVHWALNAAAALLAACAGSGIKPVEAAEALDGYAPPPGRGVAETLALPGGGAFELVDDAYNANPESMRAALGALAVRPAGRKLAALGEMFEIGSTSEAEHAALAEPLSAAGVTVAFLGGAGMEALSAALPGTIQQHFAVKSDELFDHVKNTLADGDLLLIKGSNASGMNRLADRLRQWSAAADGRVMESGAEFAARD
ncbi:MAG: UDP-N-acetylmuramoyl-tripeptide--D-alanyl-D-alanine ligase [Pseudomonadota bacterium]